MESVYNLESKLAVLKEHQKKKSLNVVFGGLLIFTSHIILVILVLTLIISWLNNDNFTFIQILKYHIGKYTLNRTKDCIGLLLGVFERDQTGMFWYFRVMADPIHGNKVTDSIADIKTLLGQYSMCNCNSYNSHSIRHPLPGEPLIQFNKWIQLANRFTYVGLGWNIQQGMNFDLDASIITFDRINRLLEIISHKNMQSYNHSIIHYGDNRTGLGEGDDEVLSVDFAALDPNTFTMAVIINSFKGNSMINVRDAFIRLYDRQKTIGV
jgi:hypothetical protein